MRVALLFAILGAACSGGLGIEPSREKPVLRLVECGPAQPLFVEVDGRVTTHGRLDGTGMGWASGGKKRATTLSFGMPSTSGRIEAAAIRKVVEARKPELTKCYAERETATRQAVTWRFSVKEDGKVLHSNPTSFVLQSPTNTCISRLFNHMVFPARTSGGTVMVTMPLTFDTIPLSERPRLPTGEKLAWTPFAVGAFAPERAATVARASESALRGRAAKLEACFKANARVTGSLRAILGIESDGDIAQARAGGLGEPGVEKCIETELDAMKVVNPYGSPAEVACDFARGDAQPWRVSPTEIYGVIAASKKAASYRKVSIALGALEPEPLPTGKTYLIVADPDAPGSVLSNALAWASEGDASLVTLRDGKGAPAFLGVGRVGFDDSSTSRPTLVLGRGKVQACIGRQTREGKVSEAGVLALRLAKRCKSMRCGSIVIGIDDLAPVKDLVELTGAARRAGFDRVLIGGRVACERIEDVEDLEP